VEISEAIRFLRLAVGVAKRGKIKNSFQNKFELIPEYPAIGD